WRSPPAERFLVVLDQHLFVAPVCRDLAVDICPVSDLCDGDGVCPPVWPRRDPAPDVYEPAVGPAIEPPAALSRNVTAEPVGRRAHRRRISRPEQRPAPAADRDRDTA